MSRQAQRERAKLNQGSRKKTIIRREYRQDVMKKKVHHSSTFLMHFHRQNEISAFCVRENEAFSSRNEKGKYFATSQENYTLLLR